MNVFFVVIIVFLQRMHLRDIVEVRPGTHSFGFVGTRSTDKHKVVRTQYYMTRFVLMSFITKKLLVCVLLVLLYLQCLSLIGSECTLDIQFSNETARNLFAERFRVLLIYLLSQSSGDLNA